MPTGNTLLDSLPEHEVNAVRPHLKLVALAVEESLYRPGHPLPYVWFPVDCSVALVHKTEDGSEAELSSIGREGIATPRPLLGVDRLSSPSLCIVSGSAHRMPVRTFLGLADECPTLQRLALRYNGVLMTVYAHISICNRFHEPVQRFSRWLLLAQYRAQRDSFDITHQFLARLLGTHRPAVSLVVSTLQKNKAIVGGRGLITIRDRSKLLAAACECYRNIIAEFSRLK